MLAITVILFLTYQPMTWASEQSYLRKQNHKPQPSAFVLNISKINEP